VVILDSTRVLQVFVDIFHDFVCFPSTFLYFLTLHKQILKLRFLNVFQILDLRLAVGKCCSQLSCKVFGWQGRMAWLFWVQYLGVSPNLIEHCFRWLDLVVRLLGTWIVAELGNLICIWVDTTCHCGCVCYSLGCIWFQSFLLFKYFALNAFSFIADLVSFLNLRGSFHLKYF